SAKDIVKIFLKPSDVIRVLIGKIVHEQIKPFVDIVVNPILNDVATNQSSSNLLATEEKFVEPPEVKTEDNAPASNANEQKTRTIKIIHSPKLTYCKVVHILYVFVKDLLQRLKQSVVTIIFEGSAEEGQNSRNITILFKEHVMKISDDTESRYFSFEKEELHSYTKQSMFIILQL
ncbi:hypothetical protein RFI_24364, partial [Reticulomyxa filosa]